MKNFVDEEFLLIERPNLRKECNINSDEDMNRYLIAYNTYNKLLMQFMLREYKEIRGFDEEFTKRPEEYKKVSIEDMDLYQYASSEYLNFFYLRNNIYIERLNSESIDYLLQIYHNKDFNLDSQKEEFIRKTYLTTIIENPNLNNYSTNYGPDNKNFIRPVNAIIFGMRYNQFANLEDTEELGNMFFDKEFKLQLIINTIEKQERKKGIPFYIIKYDEFSINQKKTKK